VRTLAQDEGRSADEELDGSSPTRLLSRVGAVNQPDHSELEQAILQYLGSELPSGLHEGTLFVR
jgi:hypothetical protein